MRCIKDSTMIISNLQLIDNPGFSGKIFPQRADFLSLISIDNMNNNLLNLNKFCIFKKMDNFIVASEGSNIMDSMIPACFAEMNNLLALSFAAKSCADYIYEGGTRLRCAGGSMINSRNSPVASENIFFPLSIFALPSLTHLNLRDYNEDNINPRNSYVYLHEAPPVVSTSFRSLYTQNFCFKHFFNESTVGRFHLLRTLSFDQMRYFREYKPPDLQEIKRTDWNNIDCSGPLPVSMHKLESIETLYMKTLYFTGEIPQSLFQIPTLKRLEIYSLNRRISTNVNFLNTRTKVTGELNFINVAAIFNKIELWVCWININFIRKRHIIFFLRNIN